MNQEKIGKFIADARKKQKLTQEGLAEKLGVNSRSISRWETGKCMPDLSLYKPLCEALDITINELLSGEKLSQEDYQEKFEENVIKVVDKVERNNKAVDNFIKAFVVLMSLVIVFFLGLIFYTNFHFTQKYDENKMSIIVGTVDNQDIKPSSRINLELYFRNKDDGSVSSLITQYKKDGVETGVIFVTVTKTLEIMNMNNDNFRSHGHIDLTNSYMTSNLMMNKSKLPNKIEVYYTTESFKKIAKADNKELIKIISKSHLMYESE